MINSAAIFILLILNIMSFFLDKSIQLILISLTITGLYLLLKPRSIIHPSNMIFAFSFLYFVFPSTVYLVYDAFNIPYILPWGQLYKWDELSRLTYFDALLAFVIPFFTFRFLINENKLTLLKKIDSTYKVSTTPVVLFFISLLVLVALFVQLTGGVSSWLYDYQYTYLAKKAGYGHINFLILYLSNCFVFICGVFIFWGSSNRAKKVLYLLMAIIIVIFVSYVQGVKSRFIVLSLLFFLPALAVVVVSYKRLIIVGVSFILVFFLGNYFRSDGYYSTFSMAVEYVMSYFNVYPLHDMYINEHPPEFFSTAHHIFMKPFIALGLVNESVDYDLSVMLTKMYFPEQWDKYKATQQWPLVTELYVNYYGMLFGWLPLFLYSALISYLFRLSMNGSVAMLMIYMLEFLRMFTTFRSVLIPWETPVFLTFYVLTFIIVRFVVKKSLNKGSVNEIAS